MRHTLGPWRLTDKLTVTDNRGYHLAYTGNSLLGPEQAQGNARLMAAAPELLAELHRLVEDAKAGRIGTVFGAERAIDKAEG